MNSFFLFIFITGFLISIFWNFFLSDKVTRLEIENKHLREVRDNLIKEIRLLIQNGVK